MINNPPIVLAQREGFRPPGLEEFEYPCFSWSEGWQLFGQPACVNRVAVLTFLVAALLAVLFLWGFRRPLLVPRGRSLQNFVEILVDFVRQQLVLDVIGPEGLRFLPYLTTLLLFVFTGNLLGVLPGIHFPVTSRVAIPAFLSLLTWLLFNWVGIKEQGFVGYLRHTLFPPDVPPFLYLLITPIEAVSIWLVRPLTLTIRLLANMIAGHLILAVFFFGTAYMIAPLFEGEASITPLWSVGSFAASVVLLGFEILVAGLQAYIFTMLTAVYLAGAMKPEH